MGLEIFSLQGKTAIVTGSGRSIGKGIALCLAEAGADIVVTSRTQEQIDQTADEVRARGRNALGVRFDAREPDQVDMMVHKAVEEFGKIDILVNNVGTPTHWDNLEITEKGWDSMFRENLKTAFLCTDAVSRIMREKKTGGNIINISSTSAVDWGEGRAYAAAKAAMNSFTKTCAVSFARDGIRVNAIMPGNTLHPVSMVYANFADPEVRAAAEKRVPLGRLGTPEDIGWACVYLASEAASYVTGQVLGVCGGPVN